MQHPRVHILIQQVRKTALAVTVVHMQQQAQAHPVALALRGIIVLMVKKYLVLRAHFQKEAQPLAAPVHQVRIPHQEQAAAYLAPQNFLIVKYVISINALNVKMAIHYQATEQNARKKDARQRP